MGRWSILYDHVKNCYAVGWLENIDLSFHSLSTMENGKRCVKKINNIVIYGK